MKSKAIPKLRFKGFHDKWINTPFKNIAQRISKRSSKQGLPRISFDDINSGMGTINKIDTTNEQGIYFQTGDVLFGKLRPYLKNWLLTNFSGIAVGDFWVLRSKSKHFLYSLIQTNRYFYISNITSGTKMPRSDWNLVSNYKFYVPSLLEQHQIGEFFATLDKLIRLQQKKVTLLKRLKKAYLQKLFPCKNETVPRIRFRGFNDKWAINTLGELGNTFTSLTGKNKKDFGHGEAEYIPYMNVHDNPIALRNYTGRTEIDNKQNQVKKGDIFFTTSSETPEEVGFSSVWIYNTKNVYLNSFSFGYRLKYPFNLYYVGYALRAPLMRSKIYPLAQGISRYNMSKRNLMKITFEYPSLKEQNMIGYLFKYVADITNSQNSKLGYLQELKKSYLQKMFC